MEPGKLTDSKLLALTKKTRNHLEVVIDGVVPGLSARLGPGGTASWSLVLRVVGEGGVNEHGRALRGRKKRIGLGNYPAVSLQHARAKATELLLQASQGTDPKQLLSKNATSKSPTVEAFAKVFMTEYVHFKELDSAAKYEYAFSTHIVPKVGHILIELLTREDVRGVMQAARIRRKREHGKRGGVIGGVEAARTVVGVLRQMISWGIEEQKLKRSDNPAANIQRNLPKKKRGERVLSLREARIVWEAAKLTGYPFGTHTQLMLLSGGRLDEWASAEADWLDFDEALCLVPSRQVKSDLIYVRPLVKPALDILRELPQRTSGPYILSTSNGKRPVKGFSKFYKTRLREAIISLTGEPIKKFTSHDLRRTVATRIAEHLGEAGDKVVKRVLGHSESGSVTSIYNRYGYVREVRRALERWATELTSPETLTLALPHHSQSVLTANASAGVGFSRNVRRIAPTDRDDAA